MASHSVGYHGCWVVGVNRGSVRGKSFITFAEINANVCALNGPWTNPNRQNMQRVLRAARVFPSSENEVVAAALYKDGVYKSQLYQFSLMCLGQEKNPDVAKSYREVPQMACDFNEVTWMAFLDSKTLPEYVNMDYQEIRKTAYFKWEAVPM